MRLGPLERAIIAIIEDNRSHRERSTSMKARILAGFWLLLALVALSSPGLTPTVSAAPEVFQIDPKTSQVLRSTVVDPDGSENTIRFLELKTNVGVKKEFFSLDPAPGTEIIDLTQMGAGATRPPGPSTPAPSPSPKK